MRFAFAAVLLVAVLAGPALAQTTDQAPPQQPTTEQPPPSGALQPQSTTPLQGATPATPTAPGAAVPPAAPPLVTPTVPGTNSIAPPPLGRMFTADTGIMFNAIKPDKVMDFETVIAKLRMALATSTDPVRQQQAKGWKIYKMLEPGPNNTVLYVYIMDPAIKGADYGVAKILSEAYPTEITDLYRMYIGAFATAGQTIDNLLPVPEPGTGTKGLANEGTATGTGTGTTTTPPSATPPATRPQTPPPGSVPPTRVAPAPAVP